MTRRVVLCAALLLLAASPAWAQPANDECANATVIGQIPFADALDVSAATADPGDPAFDCSADSPPSQYGSTVWYRYTATAAVNLEIATLGSDYDAILAAFRGTCGALTLAFCNDDHLDENRPEGDDSTLLVTLGAGESVYVVAADGGDGGLPTTLILDVQPSPLFIANGWEHTRYPMTSVAGGPTSDFLVAWAAIDSPDEVIRARLMDRRGLPKGPVFDVGTAGDTFRPDVAADGTGAFVVVWTDYTADAVMARRVDAAGTPQGTPFQVNVGSVYAHPAVAADSAGNFVVAWTNDSDRISAQRIDTTNAGLVADLTVGTLTGRRPSVSMASDGRFVVAWKDESGLDGSSYGVVARLYDAAASSAGAAFVVNTYTTGSQGEYGPDVAMTDAGDFVVVWQSDYDQNPDVLTIVLGRGFDASGAPLTGEFQVNTGTVTNGYYGEYGDGRNNFPSVAADGDGEFVVAWHRAYSGPYGRRLDATPAPSGDEFQVSTFRANYQAYYRTDVAAAPDGSFVVVWDELDFNTASEALGRGFPASGCPAEPAAGCRQSVVDFKGKLKIKVKSGDPTKSVLAWKWTNGEAVAPGELGDPLTADGYRLCIWDGSDTVVSEPAVAPGGLCSGKPCWKATSTGFVYKDKTSMSGGVKKLLVKAADAGRAKALVKAKGAALEVPPLPLVLPAVVQLHADTGTCWSAVFDVAGMQRNTADSFGGQAEAGP